MSDINDPWYLLYSGQSVDGMGAPDYSGRTLNKKTAYIHFKTCQENPYSTGMVMIADERECRRANKLDFIEFERKGGPYE